MPDHTANVLTGQKEIVLNTLIINIIRKKQFYSFFMPITIKVFDKESNLICRKHIVSWKAVRMQLPKQDYIITFSNKMLFARTVSSSVIVNGAIADEVQIDIEICHIHWLYIAIPLLGLLTPLFDYRISTIYQGQNPEIQKRRRRKVKLLSLPFLLLELFSLFEIISIWTNQLYLPNIEIEQWALEGTDAYTMYTVELLANITSSVLILPILTLLLMLSMVLFRNINRQKYPDEKKPVNENAPAILYLRPFGDDKLTAKEINRFLRPGVSEEEALVSVLDDIAPVLCIGRPSKKYLPDGAARITIPNDTWKERVAELVQKAELVVLRLGKSDGVLLELQYCLENLDLRKLVLILPNFKSISDWNRVQDILKCQGITDTHLLKVKKRRNKGSIWGFLYFDECGQTIYRPLKISRMEAWIVPLEDKIKNALGGVSAKFGLKAEKRNSRPWIIGACAFYTVFIVIMLLNAYVTFKGIEHGRFPKDLIIAGQQIENVGETIEGWSNKMQTDYLFFLFLDGLMFQDEDSILTFYTLESELMNYINSREYELLMENAEGYPTRYLTLLKKYCTDEGYEVFINYFTQCIELSQSKQGERPQVRILDRNARIALHTALKEIPLYAEENLSPEEQLSVERQIRAAVLELQADGYNMVPLMRSEFAETGSELYQAVVSPE